jgi:hypothetical protein
VFETNHSPKNLYIMSNLNDLLGDNGITSGAVNHPVIQSIKSQLFTVEKKPLTHPAMKVKDDNGIERMMFDTKYDAPELVGLYKTTGGRCLGTAKDSYGILQPEEFLDSIAMALDSQNFDFAEEKFDYISVKEDSVISFKVELANVGIINNVKKDDRTKVYVLFTTSFDGSISTTMALYQERLICTNGMVRKERGAIKRFRHTANSNARALAYAHEIAAMSTKFNEYEELIKAMDRVELKSKQVDELITEITGYNVKEYANLHRTQQTIIDGIRQAQAREFADTGATLYGLLNTFTRYTNYDESGKLRDKEYVMFGTGDQLNTKAQKVLEGVVMN